ncbi:hypothetical protein EI555_001785, partial [Monodon monoceros]
VLRCHVCEKENSFDCERPTDCKPGVPYCSSVAVRIFPRFFYVSKQCVKYCGTISPPPQMAKSFVLIKPTPFLFMACCKQDLCNNQKPIIKENIEDRYKEGGVSSRQGRRGSSAGLVTFLTLASGLLGLRLP